MAIQSSSGRIHLLRNVLLTVITIATLLSLYNAFIIYPSFTRLVVQYTKNDAIRAARYVSTTIALSDGGIPAEPLGVQMKNQLRQMESSFELIKLKIYTSRGETIYSTDVSDIGNVNRSEYFKEMAAQGSNQALLVKRDEFSLEGSYVD